MPVRSASLTQSPASVCIPCGPRLPPTPCRTMPTLPRCRSGWGTRIFRRRACMISASPDPRTARPLRCGTNAPFHSNSYFSYTKGDDFGLVIKKLRRLRDMSGLKCHRLQYLVVSLNCRDEVLQRNTTQYEL